MELTTRWTDRCWRCEIELTEQNRYDNNCPRCGTGLQDGPIDVEPLTAEQKHDRRCWAAAIDLAQVWRNWGNAFNGLMDRDQEPDYSLVHEFATEVMEHSFPYLKRLMEEGLVTPDSQSFLRETLNSITMMLLSTCQQLENIMWLTGKWSEFDEETKREWLKNLGFTNSLLGFVETEQKRIGCD